MENATNSNCCHNGYGNYSNYGYQCNGFDILNQGQAKIMDGVNNNAQHLQSAIDNGLGMANAQGLAILNALTNGNTDIVKTLGSISLALSQSSANTDQNIFNQAQSTQKCISDGNQNLSQMIQSGFNNATVQRMNDTQGIKESICQLRFENQAQTTELAKGIDAISKQLCEQALSKANATIASQDAQIRTIEQTNRIIENCGNRRHGGHSNGIEIDVNSNSNINNSNTINQLQSQITQLTQLVAQSLGQGININRSK
jgi:hypothetical protein